MLPRTDDTTVFMLLAEATGRGKGEGMVFIWPSKALEEKDCLRLSTSTNTACDRVQPLHSKLLDTHTTEAASLQASEIQNKRLCWT